ncbi:MAG TPA: ArsR family transcriptional regulator [Anaerolineales bacterium]|nr:ArsR family transcriptional regulator [Anaerolineales bacterium]
MQPKRRQILDFIQEHGSASVDELAEMLQLTSVTVRHHLEVLREENFVSAPHIRIRATPGRPQYEYTLTAQAIALFTRNYAELAQFMLAEVRQRFSPEVVTELMTAVGERLIASAQAQANRPSAPNIQARLQQAVSQLNEKGYHAYTQSSENGTLLYTQNCPYGELAPHNPELCCMDQEMVDNLVGINTERVCSKSQGDASCVYLIPIASISENVGY